MRSTEALCKKDSNFKTEIYKIKFRCIVLSLNITSTRCKGVERIKN